MPARLTAWLTTCPPMSAPWVRLKTPRTALPIGVRAVDTMTASTMALAPSSSVLSKLWVSHVAKRRHAREGGHPRKLEAGAVVPRDKLADDIRVA